MSNKEYLSIIGNRQQRILQRLIKIRCDVRNIFGIEIEDKCFQMWYNSQTTFDI